MLSLLVALTVACNGSESDGPLGAVCESDADCESLHCIAAEGDPPADLEPLALACGELAADGDENDDGRACETGEDCARGICLLAGGCARPCVDD